MRSSRYAFAVVDGPRVPAVEVGGVPGPDARRRQVDERVVTEDREDVESQQALVELPGARSQLHPLGEPAARVVAQRDAPGDRIDPRAAIDRDTRLREEHVGLALGREGARRGVHHAVDPVAHLEAT